MGEPTLKKPCRKCLLENMDRDEYLEGLYSYIKSYPAEKRTDDATYQRRLECCTKCGELSDGMCALCGCFVELRALKKNSYCPHGDKKW